MCGRFVQTHEMSAIAEQFSTTSLNSINSLPASWNIAPTNPIYIVRENGQGRELAVVSWGLIGSWHKSIADARASQSHAINARSESIHEKPTFREAFRTSRCLIPVQGYYEWASALGPYKPKQPFYISGKTGTSLSIAGLWRSWRSTEGELIESAAIITREAVGELATIHSRMPLLMPSERWADWLNPKLHKIEALQQLMENIRPAEGLIPIPVSSSVNTVAQNNSDLISKIDLGEPETLF
jgi:putative SOS response-associated peptidase YedK